MDGIINLAQSALHVKDEHCTSLIATLASMQIFRNATDQFVGHYISGLNLPGRLQRSLLMLKPCLEQCSEAILEKRSASVITICVKICRNKKENDCVPIAYDILTVLLKRSTLIPDLGKAFSGVFIAEILKLLDNVPHYGEENALELIHNCLIHYPGPCKSYRAAIQTFTLKFIDSKDKFLVIKAGKCLFRLQKFEFNQMKNAPNADVAFQKRLIFSMHKSLDDLYANCPEIYGTEEDDEHPPLASNEALSDEPVERISQLVLRLENLVTLMQTIILEPHSLPKKILYKKILELIQRGLGVTCVTLEKNPIQDNLVTSLLLPKIHIALYKLLKDVILVLQSHLKVHVREILNFPMETLKWTSKDQNFGSKKNYWELRVAAYHTLQTWCEVQRSGSCIESVAEHLWEQIKSDIITHDYKVTLKVGVGSRHHLSKKARKQLHKAENAKTHLVQTHSKGGDSKNSVEHCMSNQQLVVAAFNCFVQTVLVATCFLAPNLLKDIQETVTSLVYKVFMINACSEGNIYNETTCKTSLLKVLYSLIISPHHLIPPPVEFAIEVFSKNSSSCKNFEVRKISSCYTNNIENILHPQKESMFFPIDRIRKTKDRIAYKHRIVDNDAVGSSEDYCSDTSDKTVEFDILMAPAVSEMEEKSELQVEPQTDETQTKETSENCEECPGPQCNNNADENVQTQCEAEENIPPRVIMDTHISDEPTNKKIKFNENLEQDIPQDSSKSISSEEVVEHKEVDEFADEILSALVSEIREE